MPTLHVFPKKFLHRGGALNREKQKSWLPFKKGQT